jgi:hypothetical protein
MDASFCRWHYMRAVPPWANSVYVYALTITSPIGS